MYWRGEGVTQDLKLAREWLEKGYRHVSFLLYIFYNIIYFVYKYNI